jgi:hypothetical protein
MGSMGRTSAEKGVPQVVCTWVALTRSGRAASRGWCQGGASHAAAGQGSCLVLEFVHDAARQLGPNPLGPCNHGSIAIGTGLLHLARGECGKDRQRDLAADPLHLREKAEPVPLCRLGEAIQMDVVFSHMGFDQKGYGGTQFTNIA